MKNMVKSMNKKIVKKFGEKVIISLILLINEVKKEIIDLDLVYDYSKKMGKYVNFIYTQIMKLVMIKRAMGGTTGGMAKG
jgi:hypothetical protein